MDLLLTKFLSRTFRTVLFSLVFVLLSGTLFSMNTLANDHELTPPVAPEHESAAPPNPAFVEMCLANSASVIAKGGWQLGKQLLTQSSTRGTIWRADFKIPGSTTTFVNRIICWQEPNGDKFMVMYAIGQAVPPL
jgi:hypothetical protein